MDKKPNVMVSAFKHCGISAESLADDEKLAKAVARLNIIFKFKEDVALVHIPAEHDADDFEEEPQELLEDLETTDVPILVQRIET